jgi:hypothetical protein
VAKPIPLPAPVMIAVGIYNPNSLRGLKGRSL